MLKNLNCKSKTNTTDKIVNGINDATNDIINVETSKVIPPWRRKNVSVNEMSEQLSIKQSPMASINFVEKNLENNENVKPEEKPVRAPPPSFPSTLFSPTENKQWNFRNQLKMNQK
ncbi:hypothetical protein WUBG_16221 [Wuchereria bancrofti]|uniref:Uncharacterized protein n=1 Tax=Wuchereria bancrofti TaxID=6293 RepID=J9DTA7_WUCBA|nr:hypothetical protein WUBG_16221 [Wuchereria bancrofti]